MYLKKFFNCFCMFFVLGICHSIPGNNHYPGKGLKCSCGPEFTGERCETQIRACSIRCLNGGNCLISSTGIAYCNCPPDLTGL